MPRISTNQIAMGVGSAGAMVDVSSYVEFSEPVTRTYGRQDEFRDTTSGRFSFTLNNADGRFTPGNVSSPLATTVTEGMTVSWLLGTRLLVGTIRAIQPGFPGDVSAWSQVQIDCDDMLGAASRHDVSTLEDALDEAVTPYAFWPLDDSVGATIAREQIASGMGDLALYRFNSAPSTPTPLLFGVLPVPGLSSTQMRFEGMNEQLSLSTNLVSPNFAYPQTSMGAWGFWVTPSAVTRLVLSVGFAGLDQPVTVTVTSAPSSAGVALTLGTASPINSAIPLLQQYKPHYVAFQLATTVSAGVWTITGTLFVDGVSGGSGTYTQAGSVTSLTTTDRQPTTVKLTIGDGASDSFAVVSRLLHSASVAHEELVNVPTEASILAAVDAAVPEMVFDVLPTDLSLAAVAPASGKGTALDVINDVMRTEQGYVWSVGSGTLLAPVQKVRFRSRNRPSTVTASFDVERELDSTPEFARDVTNMVSSETVRGPVDQVTVTDTSVVARVGSASSSDETLFSYTTDMTAWGQDRLMRGENVTLRVASITVDAFTTPTDRSSSLLGLVLGDRVRLTNLPSTQLGFSQWDGWLIGASESHRVDGYKFTFYFAPIFPVTAAVFDTAVFADSGIDQTFADVGSLYLTAAITSGATSMTVAQVGSTTGPNLERTTMGYRLQVDNETVTVTAAAAASGGSQVLTVTRASAGSAAAAHLINAKVTVAAPVSRFIF